MDPMQTIVLPRFFVVATTIAVAAMVAACSATVPDTPGDVGASQTSALSSANCRPLTCQQVGASCNQTGDGCGGIIDCGTCPVGAWCNSINCVHLCSPPNCPSPTIATSEFQPCSGGVCFMGNGNVG